MTVALRLVLSMGGLRIIEIVQSKKRYWEEREGYLCLPDTKMSREDQSRSHDVPLTSYTKEAYNIAKVISPVRSEFLFPNPIDVTQPMNNASPSKAMVAICEHFKFKRALAGDLRRTWKSTLLERELVDERDIDIWHNHGQNADVARKHYTVAEFKMAKQRAADAIDVLMTEIIAIKLDIE